MAIGLAQAVVTTTAIHLLITQAVAIGLAQIL